MAAYNRYKGNSGRVQRVEEGQHRQQDRQQKPQQGRQRVLLPLVDEEKRSEPPRRAETRPPSPLSGLSGEVGKMLGKLSSLSLETEDLLLIMILYLMYRESGDTELLIMIGALLFL